MKNLYNAAAALVSALVIAGAGFYAGQAFRPSATAAAPAIAAVPADPNGPPLVNGVYVTHDACPGEGCDLKSFYWRAPEQVALREHPDAGPGLLRPLRPRSW